MPRIYKSPQAQLADRMRKTIFGQHNCCERTPADIAKGTGLPPSTVRSWKERPGTMPVSKLAVIVKACGIGKEELWEMLTGEKG